MPWQFAALPDFCGSLDRFLNGQYSKIRLPAPIATYGMLLFGRGLSFTHGRNLFDSIMDSETLAEGICSVSQYQSASWSELS